MQNNQTFVFARGYFWCIRPIIRKPTNIISAVILVNPCLAKSKDGDYHQEMNSFVFFEWFENQLMPALKNSSLVVLDNASYHNVKTEDTVCPNLVRKKLFSKTILKAAYVSSLTSFNRKVVLF
jgi:hypothetical protein